MPSIKFVYHGPVIPLQFSDFRLETLRQAHFEESPTQVVHVHLVRTNNVCGQSYPCQYRHHRRLVWSYLVAWPFDLNRNRRGRTLPRHVVSCAEEIGPAGAEHGPALVNQSVRYAPLIRIDTTRGCGVHFATSHKAAITLHWSSMVNVG